MVKATGATVKLVVAAEARATEVRAEVMAATVTAVVRVMMRAAVMGAVAMAVVRVEVEAAVTVAAAMASVRV